MFFKLSKSIWQALKREGEINPGKSIDPTKFLRESSINLINYLIPLFEGSIGKN